MKMTYPMKPGKRSTNVADFPRSKPIWSMNLSDWIRRLSSANAQPEKITDLLIVSIRPDQDELAAA